MLNRTVTLANKTATVTAVDSCSSRRASITLKMTGVKKIYLDNWRNIVNSEKVRFLDFEFILVNPHSSLFFSAEGEMRSQKAQLESEERGRGEVSAADLLWLLPPPEPCTTQALPH